VLSVVLNVETNLTIFNYRSSESVYLLSYDSTSLLPTVLTH